MSFNSKAAIAACFATLFIISGTAALAQSGAHLPTASYGVSGNDVRPEA